MYLTDLHSIFQISHPHLLKVNNLLYPFLSGAKIPQYKAPMPAKYGWMRRDLVKKGSKKNPKDEGMIVDKDCYMIDKDCKMMDPKMMDKKM